MLGVEALIFVSFFFFKKSIYKSRMNHVQSIFMEIGVSISPLFSSCSFSSTSKLVESMVVVWC